MDNVLFYGSQDEQTRRQVRSAAAKHSHAIGPRKPKSMKRTTSRDAPTTSRRKTTQHHPSASTHSIASESAATSSAHSSSHSRAVSDATIRPPYSSPAAAHAHAPATPLLSHPVDAIFIPPHKTVDPSRHHNPDSIDAWNRAQPPEHASTHLATEEAHQRGPWFAAPHHPSPPPLRLPQYSWTEYPRYGLGTSRPHSHERPTEKSMSGDHTSGSRSFSGTRPSLPPLSRPASSASHSPVHHSSASSPGWPAYPVFDSTPRDRDRRHQSFLPPQIQAPD